LNHGNIIKYCKRPFKDISEMNYNLIKNWNERVKLDDLVFHLGDFCFKETNQSQSARIFRTQLNGDIIFLKGNHDNNNSLKTCIEFMVIHLGGKNIFLTHRPENTKFGYDLYLVGHVHEKWKFKTLEGISFPKGKQFWDVINIGVDVWNFKPISINEILKEYNNWKQLH